jgi:hypothetical protein
MRLTDEELLELWRHRSREIPPDRRECLTEQDWEYLLSREAGAAERARLVGHIAACAACAEEYRLLQPLRSWADEVARPLAGSRPRGDRADRWQSWLTPPRLALALSAASLLIVTQGAMLYWLWTEHGRQTARLETQLAEQERALTSARASVAGLEEQLRDPSAARIEEERRALERRVMELSRPQLDGPIVDLDPAGTGVRSSSGAQTATAPPDAQLVTLILNFAPLAARSTLEVEVTGQSGEPRWVGRTVRDREAASLNLTLPRQTYPSGDYTIGVFVVTSGRKAIATYSVTIRYAEARTR